VSETIVLETGAKNRSQAQEKISALSSQLETASTDPTAASETEVKTESHAARRALAKNERNLGPTPDAAEDLRQLGERSAQSDEEKATLRLKLAEAEAVRAHSFSMRFANFRRLQTLSTQNWRVSTKSGRLSIRPSTIRCLSSRTLS